MLHSEAEKVDWYHNIVKLCLNHVRIEIRWKSHKIIYVYRNKSFIWCKCIDFYTINIDSVTVANEK